MESALSNFDNQELNKLRLVFEQTPGAIFILNREFRFEYVNSGSGIMYLEDLLAKEAECLITGSGSLYLAVEDSLGGVIAGSGSIIYSGNPVVNVTDTGSGSVRKK